MTRLVIDRAKWGRHSYHRDGDPCCAIGHWIHSNQPEYSVLARSLHDRIAAANDTLPNGPEREQRIADLFAEAGVEVVFEGVYT